MQLSEAWALLRPTKTGAKRAAGYVGTHKTGSITGIGHAAFHKSLAGSEGKRVSLANNKDGTTDVHVRDKHKAEWKKRFAEADARERMFTREDNIMEDEDHPLLKKAIEHHNKEIKKRRIGHRVTDHLHDQETHPHKASVWSGVMHGKTKIASFVTTAHRNGRVSHEMTPAVEL
jgi:hypothetical protein